MLHRLYAEIFRFIKTNCHRQEKVYMFPVEIDGVCMTWIDCRMHAYAHTTTE